MDSITCYMCGKILNNELAYKENNKIICKSCKYKQKSISTPYIFGCIILFIILLTFKISFGYFKEYDNTKNISIILTSITTLVCWFPFKIYYKWNILKYIFICSVCLVGVLLFSDKLI